MSEFKVRDMRKNPKPGDVWETDQVAIKLIDPTPATRQILQNGLWSPLVCLSPELALSLREALLNPTPITECDGLVKELERYLPTED